MSQVEMIIGVDWSSEYVAAMSAWCAYYVRTEEYDRLICRSRHPSSGDAIPVTHEERTASNAYARKKRAALDLALAQVPQAIQDAAKEHAGRLSFEGQKEWLRNNPLRTPAMESSHS
jgi:hypothetical protein